MSMCRQCCFRQESLAMGSIPRIVHACLAVAGFYVKEKHPRFNYVTASCSGQRVALFPMCC